MSGTEFLVVVFGLFIGYWLVSRFSSGPGDKGQNAPPSGRFPPGSGAPQQQDERREGPAVPPCWHDVLNVSANADVEEIRRAYKSLMSQYHPDKVASLGPELRDLCERKTKEINVAYDQALAERGAA